MSRSRTRPGSIEHKRDQDRRGRVREIIESTRAKLAAGREATALLAVLRDEADE